jgi:hypothetical protein
MNLLSFGLHLRISKSPGPNPCRLIGIQSMVTALKKIDVEVAIRDLGIGVLVDNN